MKQTIRTREQEPELQERFPDDVVNRWMGHLRKVAEKHYLQVTKEHWGTALEFGSPTGSPVMNHQEHHEQNHGTKKPSEWLGSDALTGDMKLCVMTPTGVEPVLPP